MTKADVKRRSKRIFLLILAAFLFFSVLSDPEGCAKCFEKTLSNLYVKVLPVIFPFMIISRILSEIGTAGILKRIISKPFRRLWKLPECAAIALILGAVCSYPVGAFTAVNIFRQGGLSRENAERAAAIFNNTGPGFPVAVVGGLLLGNKKCGYLIWITGITVSLIMGILLGTGKKAEAVKIGETEEKNRGFLKTIIDSVSSSALSCVSIAGTVVLFSLIAYRIITVFRVTDPFFSAIIYSFFEFSEGCAKASLTGGPAGAAICAFSVSFGGLSVIFQSAAEMDKAGLSPVKMAAFKLIQGLLSAAAVYFLCSRFPALAPLDTAAEVFLQTPNDSLIPAICFYAVSLSSLIKIFHLIYE